MSDPRPTLHGQRSTTARLTRRALLGGAVGLAAGLAGCGWGSGRWQGRFLTVVTTGGALREALNAAGFLPFHSATACQIHDIALPVGEILRELRRQALVGQMQWDAVVLDAPHAAMAARQTPGLFAAPAGGEEGTAFATDMLALAYRTAMTGGRLPASWAEVWSPELPGARRLPQDPVGLLEVALLADGVAPAELYPLDLDRAFASLDRLRALGPSWWRVSEGLGEALALGEVDLALCYGGELHAAIDDGADATIATLPTPALPLTLAVPQRAVNGDIARDFAAYLQGEEAGAKLRDRGYGAAGALPPSGLALDVGWWRERGVEASERFAAWFAAGR